MAAKAVQISLDADLLAQVDRDPDAKRLGRSAFVRQALQAYLRWKARRDVDEQLRRGYGGKAAREWEEEIAPLMEAQAWPED